LKFFLFEKVFTFLAYTDNRMFWKAFDVTLWMLWGETVL
jgi:hypothetical protein